MRTPFAVGVVLALGIAACEGPVPAGPQEMPAAQKGALDGAPVAEPLRVDLLVPADGFVFPWTFPAPLMQWDARLAANTFRVRVRVPSGAVVLEAYSEVSMFRPEVADWQKVRTAVGEGGAFEVELAAASVLPDGTTLRGPVKVVSRGRFSGPGEHPTGHVLFGWKIRPPGQPPGPVSLDLRGVIPKQVAMDGTVETLLDELPGVAEMRAAYRARMLAGDPTVMGGGGPGLEPEGTACKPGFCPPGQPVGPAPASGIPGPGATAPPVPGPGAPVGSVPGQASPTAVPGNAAPLPAVPLPPPGGEEPSTPVHLDPEDVGSPRAEPVARFSVDLSPLKRPSGAPTWEILPQPEERGCVACHSMSSDARYLAANSPENATTPENWGVTQGTLYLIRRSDKKIVHTMPGGLTVRFHPVDPDLMVFSSTSNSTGVKQRVSVYRADIHRVDVRTMEESPVPGAAEPDRCEMFPDVAADGSIMAFTRSLAGQPCEGSRGLLEIATIPWNGGRGGAATPLVGASDNGASNVQPRISPDGRWIVFYRATRGFFSMGSADLWVVPATGGEARRLDVSTPAMETWHAFSPDGKWLAFISNRDRVDRPRGYIARFHEDGHVSAAVPLPGAGDPDAHVHSLDWGP